MNYDYNDIRNPTWFDRLIRGVKSDTISNIIQRGAQPDDPYWKAVESEKVGDLGSARSDAFRRQRERMMANWGIGNRNQRMNEQVRQRAMRESLASQWKPNVGLGTMGGGEAPQFSGQQEPMMETPTPSPTAYRPPLSGYQEMPAQSLGFNYNPYTSKTLKYKQKKLEETMNGLRF